MNEITILPVPPADLIARWQEIEPMLDKAMPVNLRRYLPIDILALCIQNMGQGWLIREHNNLLAVMVTKIDQYPRRRGLSIFCLAGTRMSEWFEKANEIVTEHARRMGCDHVEVQGRRGWDRVLDLEPRSTFLVKDLTMNGADGGAHA